MIQQPAPPSEGAPAAGARDGEPTAGEASAAAERAARQAYGKLLARLTTRTGDIEAAEEALAEAFMKALTTWPKRGVPDAPEAWLTTVAMNAVRDGARHNAVRASAQHTLMILHEERDLSLTRGPDERLGLILAASHPAIQPAVHAPLILQTVFGVTAEEMAPAFLLSAATIGQRLVRAKSKIRLAGVPFQKDPADKVERLARALDAIYALHTLATAAPPSPAATARAADAYHLAHLVADLAPENAEAKGLVALIAYCEARRPARRTADGGYVPLSRQDVNLWSDALIGEAEGQLATAAKHQTPGRYQIEAAIQSVHCDRKRTGRTQWSAVAALHDALSSLSPSTGAAVARAAAHGEAFGAEKGLAILDEIPSSRVTFYQPYWAVRASL
ncbi:MAG: DUF6596 domain-containing protein, partial [Pseudomonadota bacterium]